MSLLDWIPGVGSIDKVRVKNLKRCVSESANVKLIDARQRGAVHQVTILICENTSLADELLRMLNTPHVSVLDIYIEDGETYIEIGVS